MINLKRAAVGRAGPQPAPEDVIYVRGRSGAATAISRAPLSLPPQNRIKSNREPEVLTDAEDVIDLGAPLLSRKERARNKNTPHALPPRKTYVPNPRLYPGDTAKTQPRPGRAEARSKSGRTRQRKRVLRRPVPNSRLYRPAPPKPPPPPAQPRTTWPPPPPPRALDTASRVALRLGERRQAVRTVRPPLPTSLPLTPSPVSKPAPLPSRRLVVTLPAATTAGGDSPEPQQYFPHSEHFRARSSPHTKATASHSPPPAARVGARRAMDTSRHSASPEDCSDGNETLSAPSEFLAEFLSAIMRRQYAEALKYCRLILQYEPHNATARGFYPLLQHKVQNANSEGDQHSSSEEASAHSNEENSPPHQDEQMEQTGDSDEEEGEEGSGGSVASQSSLELDSEPSLELSRRTDSGSGSGSAACWESTGSASRSDADDNGNGPPPPHPPLPPALRLCHGDLENDNAGASAASKDPHHSAHLKSDSVSSLRRLRAQFACSIK